MKHISSILICVNVIIAAHYFYSMIYMKTVILKAKEDALKKSLNSQARDVQNDLARQELLYNEKLSQLQVKKSVLSK